jgi:hypothetical protein
MKISKGIRRTAFRTGTGAVVALVTPKWPGWQVKIKVPPLPVRFFLERGDAEQHAAHFARRACAQAAGYAVHATADGRFAVTRPDGTPVDPPQASEGDAWSAAFADSVERG